MAGEVTLRSVPGQGSTFAVTLPFGLVEAPERVPEPRLGSGAGEQSLAGKRVLVVDDADTNLFVARHVLERAGLSVTTASNGQIAIDFLRAEPERFDAVLMDVQMPGMDGYEVTRTIRDQLGLGHLPVIALTADARESERKKCELSGMDDFLSKPFEAEALFTCLRRQIFPAGGSSTSVPFESRVAPPEVTRTWPPIEGIDSEAARAQFDGNAKLFADLLTMFLRNNAALATPPESLGGAALAEGTRLAHKLQGSAGQLGARVMAGLAAEFEDACRAGDESISEPATERRGTRPHHRTAFSEHATGGA